MMIRIYNVDLGKRLTNVIAKKIYFFSNKNFKLYEEMSITSEKLEKYLKNNQIKKFDPLKIDLKRSFFY